MTTTLDLLKQSAEKSKPTAAKSEQKAPPQSTKTQLQEYAAKEKGKLPKVVRPVEFGTRKAVKTFLSFPRSLAETLKYGSQKLTEMGEDLARREGREITPEEQEFTQKLLNLFAKPEEYAGKAEQFIKEKTGLPFVPGLSTGEETEKSLMDVERQLGIEPSIEPENAPERLASKIGEFAGPGAYFRGGVRTGALGGAGAGLAKEAGGGPGAEVGAGVAVPVILDLINAIRTGRYIPQPGEAEQLYQRGQAMGLTDEQLAPILATEGQVSTFGPLAKATRRTRTAYQESEQALGNVFRNLRQQAGGLRNLTTQEVDNLANAFQNVINRNFVSTNLSQREQQLVDYINTTINNLRAGRSSPQELVGLWRSINQIGAGRTVLNQMKEPLMRTFRNLDPEFARNFDAQNRLYIRYLNNLEHVNPDLFSSFLRANQAREVLGSVISGNLTEPAGRIIKESLFRNIASRVLTDPRLQSIHRNIIRSINENNPAIARNAYSSLEKYVKDKFPDEYEKIEWPDFED